MKVGNRNNAAPTERQSSSDSFFNSRPGSAAHFFGSSPKGASFFSPSSKVSTPFIQRRGPELLEPELEPNPYRLPPDQVEAVRERLLEPLRSYRGTTFTTRLRSLSPLEASAMLDDEAFWREIRSVFRGKTLWSVFTILYFNNRLREPDLRLSVTLHAGEAQRFLDALALVIRYDRTDQYYAVLTEVVRREFRRDPLLPQILTLIRRRNVPDVVQRIRVTSRQAHYERNEDDEYELKLYGRRQRRMIIYQTGNELRVVVRIRFVSGRDPSFPVYFFPDSSTPDRWRSAIESFWNDKFILTNGVQRLRFEVAPMFYYERTPVDKIIKVMESDEETCPGSSTPGRANASCWFTDSSDETIAHEFGHLLGAADEYNLPGSIAEIPQDIRSQLTAEDLALTTVEGIRGRRRRRREGGYDIPSLMGSKRRSTDVHERHIRRLVRQINNNLPAGTPPYRVVEL